MGELLEKLSDNWYGKEIRIKMVIEGKDDLSRIPLTLKYPEKWRRQKKAIKELFEWLVEHKMIHPFEGLAMFANIDLLKFEGNGNGMLKFVENEKQPEKSLKEKQPTQ